MPHRILIAEADPESRRMLETYLAGNLGYEVVSAESGQAAIDAAMDGRFDLCILDVGLEDLNGAEAHARLRVLQPGLETIFLTRPDGDEWTRDFLRFSIPPERVLTKPLRELSGLTRLIVGILGPPVG